MRARPYRRAHTVLGSPAAGNQQRLPKGALRQAVLDHLRAFPGADFSVADLAKVLRRPNSRKAIGNSCRYWVAVGLAVQTRRQPDRYQAAPAPTGPAASP